MAGEGEGRSGGVSSSTRERGESTEREGRERGPWVRDGQGGICLSKDPLKFC